MQLKLQKKLTQSIAEPHRATYLETATSSRLPPEGNLPTSTVFGDYHYATSPLQRREAALPAGSQVASQHTSALANHTGLPNQLKTGIESLSGMSMAGVKVHYNSAKPAQLSALAFAQGSDIHLGPGQEQHLPHEAWHVVQQAQGRVKPTLQVQGLSVNNSHQLEFEADYMGHRALTAAPVQSAGYDKLEHATSTLTSGLGRGVDGPVLQAVWEDKTAIKQLNGDDVEILWQNLGVTSNSGKFWNLYYSDEDGLMIAKANSDQSDAEPLATVNINLRKFAKLFPKDVADFPWLVYDDRAGMPKRKGGGGGGRTVSAGDATFHVSGLTDSENDQVLLAYLKTLDNYTDDSTTGGLSNRQPMGNQVPELQTTLAVAPVDSSAEHDLTTREAIPSKYSGPLENGYTVKGYFNSDLLETWSGERKTDGNPSQTAMAMYKGTVVSEKKGSPTLTAAAFGFTPIVADKGWEWLHLRAYSMGGASSGTPQLSDNLVLGTWHANSAHLAIETAAKWVASQNPSEMFLFEATPVMIPGTPIADHILYTIGISPERFMQFKIDALTRARPTSADASYWKAIMASRLLSHEGAKATLKTLYPDANPIVPDFDFIPQSPQHYTNYDELSDDEVVDSNWDMVDQKAQAKLSKKRRNRPDHEAPDDVKYVDDFSDSEEIIDDADLSSHFDVSEVAKIRLLIKKSGQRGDVYRSNGGKRRIFTGATKKGANIEYVFRPTSESDLKVRRIILKKDLKKRRERKIKK
ncbi:MAG: DUF4157 domain-containing protein [Undibacterium sp.]|nr:DUF4157 domain-containing protein [Undibacterium sp.]